MPLIDRIATFLRQDIWRVRARKLPWRRHVLVRLLRIFVLAVRGFDENQCALRASALTFYSLLSIVPVLAMAFGIAKGFGLEANLERLLEELLRGQEEVMGWVISFARSFLANVRGDVVAGVGIVVLCWTVISLLGNIERSLDDIWGVKEGRNLSRKISEYLAMMVIGPLLLIVSSSLTVFVTGQVASLAEHVRFVAAFNPLLSAALHLLPYAIIWTLFSYLYCAVPNTRVSLKSAVTAGVIAGTIYEAVQWVYLTFQIGVARTNAVYGSFAALPLFLIWLHTSWLIVLFGAEISFAVDNEETYEFEPDCLNVSLRFKRLLALRIARLCVERFSAGEPAVSAVEIAQRLEAPIRLVRELVYELVMAGILSEVKRNGAQAEGVQPAMDIEQLTINAVLERLEAQGRDRVPVLRDDAFEALAGKLEAIDRLTAQAPENIRLKDV